MRSRWRPGVCPGTGLRATATRRYCFETFVEPPWRGTCYLAANWLELGDTAGRGRQDRAKEYALARKTIFVYPLRRNLRDLLRQPLPAVTEDEDDA